jgi:hypothetical protein
MQAAPLARSRPITLVHAGSTAKHGRDPLILLDAIRHLLDAKTPGADALRVRLLGARDPRLTGAIAARFVSGVVTQEAETPWEISLETQAESSALLLALGPGDWNRIPDRLIEAFTVRRSILAFGPADSALQELLVETGIGRSYPESSALASALADLLRADSVPSPALNQRAVDPYRAKRVVEGLVELLAV